jgi:HEAT repeat protein
MRPEGIPHQGECNMNKVLTEAEMLIKEINPSLRFNDMQEIERKLLKIGAPALEPLIAAINNESFKTRHFAIGVLGDMKDKRAVKPLIDALKDKDSDIRMFAAFALGKIGDTQAVEPLIAMLKDKDSDPRAGAARGLELIGDSRAIEPLVALLKDEDVRVRSAVKEALKTFKWTEK